MPQLPVPFKRLGYQRLRTRKIVPFVRDPAQIGQRCADEARVSVERKEAGSGSLYASFLAPVERWMPLSVTLADAA
jgi:hypothetical protein